MKQQQPLCKPKNLKTPTQHLYIANCTINGAYGVGEDAIYSIFGRYGDIQYVESFDEKGYLLLSYTEKDFAINAKNDLNFSVIKELNNRKLFIRFAAEAQIKETKETSTIESTAHIVIPGLSIIKDFLSIEEEEKLLQSIDQQKWIDGLYRRVQHYGYEFHYDTKDVDVKQPLDSIPKHWSFLVDRMHNHRPDLDSPDQITINEYLSGQGIGPHVDTEWVFTNYITSISLGSSYIMDFRKVNSTIQKHVLLPRRSLCIMTENARYYWKHGIAFRKSDCINGQVIPRSRRVAITMRKIVKDPEEMKEQWKLKSSVIEKPSSIEKEYVHSVYDHIAPHFNHTRHHPWPSVESFLSCLPPGSLVADVGCGNGKYLQLGGKSMLIGSDTCLPLLKFSSEKNLEVACCNALHLPFRTSSFDAVICVALLHHMSTIEHRLQIIRELARIVKINGEILLVAWAFEQDANSKRRFEDQDVMIEWKLQEKYAQQDSNYTTNKIPNHVTVHAEKRWSVFQRYCHLFKQDELSKLVTQIPGLSIYHLSNERSNWCLHIRRTNE